MKRKDWLNNTKPKKIKEPPKKKKGKFGVVTDIVVKKQNEDRSI